MGSIATTKMPFTIRPLTPSDMRSLVELGSAAFQDDELAQAMMRRQGSTPAQLEEFLSWRANSRQREMEKNGDKMIHLGAVDDGTGQLIGGTVWKKPQASEAEGEEDKKEDESSEEKKPEIIDEKLMKSFETFLREGRAKHMGSRKDFYYLASMSVHPDHQRKGVASRLLEHTLAEVDASDMDAFLEATPAGCQLYLRHGFEILEEASFQEQHKLIVMFRKARSQRGPVE